MIARTNIDTQFTKQAIAAIRALAPEHRSAATEALLQPGNLQTPAPVFSNVIRLCHQLYGELDETTKDLADNTMLSLFEEGSHLIHNDLNLSDLLGVFGQRHTAEKETILILLYAKTASPLVRKEIILIMAK